MKAKFWIMLCTAALLLSALLPVGVQPVQAQISEPPQSDSFVSPDCPPEGPCQDKDGNWYMPEDAPNDIFAVDGLMATGGPDDYGYTWDDSIAFNWVDATGGTDVGFAGNVRDLSDPISLPFSFKYYGNTYSQIYISTAGYLTFADNWVRSQSKIPNPAEPNDIIAPYWTPIYYSATGPTGRAYYKTGGSAPNRYFVAEWYQVFYGDELYTFEVLLYENGDILFQYQQMQYNGNGYTCGSAGIEDAEGLDGLAYNDFCDRAPSQKAVLISAPGPMARTRVTPLYHGGFTSSNKVGEFNFTVRNNGDLGSDTYDISISSVWPVILYGPDGVTPLTDTDGDTLVDTGTLSQGSTFNIVAQVTAPEGLVVGDEHTAYITVVSSLNTAKTKTVRIESTVPAPFAQVFTDQNVFEMRLDLNWPDTQTSINATPSQEWLWGYDPSVVETADQNFVYVWEDGYNLRYTLLDQYGQVIKPVYDLAKQDTSVNYSYDTAIALAAAPDGRIGITWYRFRSIYRDNQSLNNYNIWFAILNPDGSFAYGPASLTNNTAFVPYGNDLVRTVSPTIAASGDNRFMLSWNQYYQPGGYYLYENYYTIRSSTGSLVTPINKMADGIPGTLSYESPKVTSLTNNRFLLAYSSYQSNPYRNGIFYCIYNSNGDLLMPETDSDLYGYQIDAVQLTGGNVLLATDSYDSIRYTILEANSLVPLDSYAPLSHASAEGGTAVSVTVDSDNHAILTWKDDLSRYLYYALLGANGTVINGPSIYRSAQLGDNNAYLETSSNGHGITTNSWEPLTDVDALVDFNALRYGAKPGGTASVWLNYANHGVTSATNPVLTLSIPAGLTYLGNDQLDCTLVDTLLTCALPDLDFLAAGKFPVYIQIPSGTPIGTTYTLNATITSDGPEADETNNAADSIVFSAIQVSLPIILTK